MADRFDLENDILAIHNDADDIDALAEAVLEDELTQDEIANALVGLAVMTRIKVNKTFETFRDALKLDHYNDKNDKNRRTAECKKTI